MPTLTMNTGSMFSGKSTLLISQGEKHMRAGQRVVYVKPSIDNRYSEDEIVTHSGIRVKAISVDLNKGLAEDINPREVDVVLIDEVQFFSKRICNSVWWLLSKGIKVYASGLDMTFLGDGFETVGELCLIADKVNKLKAVCEDCGADAVISGKRDFLEEGIEKNPDTIQLGAKETYIPLCRKCYFNMMLSRGRDDG